MGNSLVIPPFLDQSKRLAKKRKNGTRFISRTSRNSKGISGKWGGEFGNSLWKKGAGGSACICTRLNENPLLLKG
jgi:hypothetical protein